MNYYERHIGDYAKDAGHLSMLEHGAYTLLLDRYYGTEKGIPADQVYRIARARSQEEREAVDAVLSEFFTLSDEAWINGRAEEEIPKAQARINAAQTNGKKGGRPKSNPEGTQKKPGGLPAGNPGLTQIKAHQAPYTNQEQELPPTAAGEPPDPIFGTGLDFLRRKGLPEKSARSFLGLLRKELHDDLTVAELLLEAERQDVSEPQAWLTKAAKHRKSQPCARGSPPQSKTAQGIANLEAMKHENRSQQRSGTMVPGRDFEGAAAFALPRIGGAAGG